MSGCEGKGRKQHLWACSCFPSVMRIANAGGSPVRVPTCARRMQTMPSAVFTDCSSAKPPFAFSRAWWIGPAAKSPPDPFALQSQQSPNPHVGDTRAEPAGLAAGALPPQNTFRSNRDLRDALGHLCSAQGAWLHPRSPKKFVTLVLGLSRTRPQCSARRSVGSFTAARCSPTWELSIWLYGAQLR